MSGMADLALPALRGGVTMACVASIAATNGSPTPPDVSWITSATGAKVVRDFERL